MKKSFGILTLISVLWLFGQAEAQATEKRGDSQVKQTAKHGGSHTFFEEKEIRSSMHRRSNGGQSPSARRQSHWTAAESEVEFSPMAPDELAAVAEDRNGSGTISRIKNIEKRKGVKVSAETSAAVMWYEQIREDAHIDVYISGGGFRGGINPLIHNYIMISSSGLLQRLYETEVEGKMKTEKMIDRETLLEFVKWVAENGFFQMDRKYDCAEDDIQCQNRLNQYPKPIPLKLVIAVGPYRNVVSIPMFAPNLQDDLIEYPKEIRKIVEAIYDFASL